MFRPIIPLAAGLSQQIRRTIFPFGRRGARHSQAGGRNLPFSLKIFPHFFAQKRKICFIQKKKYAIIKKIAYFQRTARRHFYHESFKPLYQRDQIPRLQRFLQPLSADRPRQLQLRLRRGGRIRALRPEQARPRLVRRQRERAHLHLCRHQAPFRQAGEFLFTARHRQGRHGAGHFAAPLRILDDADGAFQDRRHRHPRHAHADGKGPRLPHGQGADQDGRIRQRRRAVRQHLEGDAQSALRALRRHHRRAGRIYRLPRRGGQVQRRAARPLCGGAHRGRHPARVLHFRHHGHAQDGLPAAALYAGAHRHRPLLAQLYGRRPALHPRRDGLGEGELGQAVRAVAVRFRHLCVRLPRQVRAGRADAAHRQVPHHHLLRSPHRVPLYDEVRPLQVRPLFHQIHDDGGRSAQPRDLPPDPHEDGPPHL